MSAIRWVAATLLAAMIGAYGSWIVNRARPTFEVADISISRAFHDRFGNDRRIAVDSEHPAISASLESRWTIPIREPSIPIEELIETVEYNRSRVQKHLQSLERLRQDLPQLRRILSRNSADDAGDAADFFDLWERNDGIIYGSVRGNFSRGTYQLPAPLPVYEGPGVLLLDIIGRTDSGVVYGASKRGGVYISALHPEDEEDLPLNEFAARALVHFDRVSLKSMLDLVEEERTARALHETMQESIDDYLVGLSRWSISVVASNAGGSSLSVAPKARLILNGAETALDDRVVIPLEHRDSDGNLIPASIPGGESRSVRFVAPELIGDLPQWETLHQMYNNSSLDCVVLLEVTPPPALGENQILSTVRKFGQLDPFAKVDFDRIEAEF